MWEVHSFTLENGVAFALRLSIFPTRQNASKKLVTFTHMHIHMPLATTDTEAICGSLSVPLEENKLGKE